MDKKNEKQKKKCFIITPIGNENSEIFRKAKGVIESTIKPILQEYDFDDIKPAYEINMSGMISTQIINRIINDDLVVANLTGNNPNVMYELCLRHVVAKPIIHICESGTSLPFDVKDNRTIFYVDDMLGAEELKYNLRKFLDKIDYLEDCMDNPIYNAYRYGKLLKETQGTKENEILKILLQIQNTLGLQQRYNTFIIPGGHSFDFDSAFAGVRDEQLGKEELRKVNGDLLQKWLPYNGHKLKVHELAKKLDTKSSTIIYVAKKVGLDVNNQLSELNADMVNKILTYICNNIIEGDPNEFEEKE